VAVAWVVVFTGSIHFVYGESLEPPAVVRAAEEATPIDTTALALALADRKLELSGLFGTDLRLTVGADVWFNQWQTGQTFGSQRQGFRNETLTTLGVGIIPNATLSYQRFFVSASYMWTPDYHFGSTTTVLNTNALVNVVGFGIQSLSVLQETHFTASRQEAEVSFGYRFFETETGFLGAAVGYKGIFQDYVTSFRRASGAVPFGFGSFGPLIRAGGHTQTNYNGWIVGLVGAASLGGGVGVFGNAAGGVLYPNCSGSKKQFADEPSCPGFGVAPYAAAKVGVSYRPFDAPLTFSAGYRIQVLNTEFKGTTPRAGNTIDLTHGLIVGANWTF